MTWDDSTETRFRAWEQEPERPWNRQPEKHEAGVAELEEFHGYTGPPSSWTSNTTNDISSGPYREKVSQKSAVAPVPKRRGRPLKPVDKDMLLRLTGSLRQKAKLARVDKMTIWRRLKETT